MNLSVNDPWQQVFPRPVDDDIGGRCLQRANLLDQSVFDAYVTDEDLSFIYDRDVFDQVWRHFTLIEQLLGQK
jgi:hypothetical protein